MTFIKTVYIPIGINCASTYYLIERNLRRQAFPFDWMYTSLPMIQHCLETRFQKFLDQNDITGINSHQSSHKYYDSIVFPFSYEKEHEHIFAHHNLSQTKTYDKFKQRCQRLLDIIDNPTIHKVFVYMDFQMPTYMDTFQCFINTSIDNCEIESIIVPR